MPARKINYVPDWIQEVELQPSDIDLDPYKGFTVKPIANYLSQHSDREYETLRDAFLKLGEECDDLRLQVESLSMQCEDSRSDYYKLEAKYHKLEADYNKLRDFYLYDQEVKGYLERLYL